MLLFGSLDFRDEILGPFLLNCLRTKHSFSYHCLLRCFVPQFCYSGFCCGYGSLKWRNIWWGVSNKRLDSGTLLLSVVRCVSEDVCHHSKRYSLRGQFPLSMLPHCCVLALLGWRFVFLLYSCSETNWTEIVLSKPKCKGWFLMSKHDGSGVTLLQTVLDSKPWCFLACVWVPY